MVRTGPAADQRPRLRERKQAKRGQGCGCGQAEGVRERQMVVEVGKRY